MGGIILSSIKAYFITTVIKITWYQWRVKYMNQWHRLKNPEIDAHKCTQLVFDKCAKPISWRKDSFLDK